MAASRPAVLAAVLTLAAGPAAAEGDAAPPLSAIDWLSRATVTPPPAAGGSGRAAGASAGDGTLVPGEISVTPLDGPTPDALGLLPAARAGLPRDLWGMTPSAALATALEGLGPDTLPALQGLILTLLVAELDPPRDAEGRGALFLARIDWLMAFGALDPALALVEAAGPDTPALVARWFDLALLAGDVAPVCAALRDRPALAPGPAARIYCTARGGDWDEAEALLQGEEGAALSPPMRRALARFLDPEAGHDPQALPVAPQASPLMWQIADALGEGWSTAQMPPAFAHADLGSGSGWKARLEAAERLARFGVLPPNRLLGLYTDRAPAASGGVWDRVAAVQRLDAALTAGEGDTPAMPLAEALPRAWEAMAAAELEGVLAHLFAPELVGRELPPDAAALAWRAALLAGLAPPPPPPLPGAAARDGFLAAIAGGAPVAEAPRPPGAMPAAVAEGLSAPPGPDIAAMLADGRRGEVLLRGLSLLQGSGMEDARSVSEALMLLRAAGQERTARQAALELLLLDRRG